jgi:ornithine cyclodeaminase/alanine dehydrogenase-like protein (mu-crystallin family)
MNTRILTATDVRQLIEAVGLDRFVDELVVYTEEAFAVFDPAAHQIPVRSGFHYVEPTVGLVEFMPVHARRTSITQKAVGYHPRNPTDHRIPTILSTVSVYDVQTGHLSALLDGVLLTALRTGVASAVASRAMAAPDSTVLGMIGCGAQGVAQAHALGRSFRFARILAHDTDPAVAATYAARLRAVGVDVPVEFADPATIRRDADILTTATSVDVGAGEVFPDGPHRPHLHINAVGADFPGKTEVPLALLHRAIVVPDFLDQALIEGESQRLDPATLGPDWLTALSDDEDRRGTLTVFDSTGWALEDHLTAAFVLDRARALGIGHDLALESVPTDPYNPYA